MNKRNQMATPLNLEVAQFGVGVKSSEVCTSVRQRPYGDGMADSRKTLLQPVPPWLVGFSMAVTVWSFFTPNPLLTICSIWMLPLLASLLWFRGEPPALLFGCTIQWLQATAAIFYCNFQNISIVSDWEQGSPEFEKATWLSMAGVLVLGIGMRVALGSGNRNMAHEAQSETRSLQIRRLFIWYLIAFVFFSFLGRVAFSIPQLTQPLLAFRTLHWVLVYLVAYSVFINRKDYMFLVLVVILEVLTGFLGFFGGFKDVFFVMLVALPGASFIFQGRRLLLFGLLASTALFLSILWTAVKVDYRQFLNQGSGQQEVVVSIEQSIEKLLELVGAKNAADLNPAFNDMLMRISYVHYFALTIQSVPTYIPYEKGALWWGALQHIFTPRLFFPNKPGISDSDLTRYYTGHWVAGTEEGTSIGIGYFGESYIDFGPVGMFAPIFLLGMFFGFLYRFFVSRSRKKIFGFAIATSILVFGAYHIETSNIKIIGGNVTVCLAMLLFLKTCEMRFWNLIVSPIEPLSAKQRAQALLRTNRCSGL
jgi:hypothetical protein